MNTPHQPSLTLPASVCAHVTCGMDHAAALCWVAFLCVCVWTFSRLIWLIHIYNMVDAASLYVWMLSSLAARIDEASQVNRRRSSAVCAHTESVAVCARRECVVRRSSLRQSPFRERSRGPGVPRILCVPFTHTHISSSSITHTKHIDASAPARDEKNASEPFLNRIYPSFIYLASAMVH